MIYRQCGYPSTVLIEKDLTIKLYTLRFNLIKDNFHDRKIWQE